MFDVIWTDPDRELVGEHRAKKDRRKEQRSYTRDRSDRSSLSTRSSLSSSDSPFSFLRSKGLRQPRAKTSHSIDSATQEDENASATRSLKSTAQQSLDSRKAHRGSGISTSGASNPQGSARQDPDQSVGSVGASNGGEMSPTLTCYDSIFSRSPESESRTSNSILERASDELGKHKSSTRTRNPISLDNMQVEPLSVNKKQSSDQGSPKLVSNQPLTPPLTPSKGYDQRSSLSSKANLVRDGIDTIQPKESTGPIPPPKNPLRRSSKRYSALFKDNDNDAAPYSADQKTTLLEDGLVEETDEQALTAGSETHGKLELGELLKLQNEVTRMAGTSPQEILERLQEIWRIEPNPKDSVSNTERHHWTLSVLYHLDSSMMRPSNSGRFLVLYEHQETVSYLAALHPNGQFCHVSEDVMPLRTCSNVHPWTVPYVSAAMFPTIPHEFDEAYALTLPSTCPASEISGTLKNISKILKPGGALQLTLIDPMPRAATMGQQMRSWFEKNLIPNLEKRFRCTNPKQMFPQWLGQAGLRGPGSTLTTIKFYALPENVKQGHERDPDPLLEETWLERETKAEVRSLVGRSLWMLVWGPYVTVDKWWWEDAACVAECLQMGTIWEHHQIRAVKDNSSCEDSLSDGAPRAMI